MVTEGGKGTESAPSEDLGPTAGEERVLVALDECMSRLHTLDRALVEERRACVAAVDAWRRLPYHEQTRSPQHAPRSWEKSERQSSLEESRRETKRFMQKCLEYLSQGRIYTMGQIMRVISEDGHPGLFATGQVAIGRADVFSALAGLPNHYARRAFVLRYKFGLEDHEIAVQLSTTGDAVPRLVNIAFDHAHMMLNVPVVALVRARFFNTIIAYGLEFPEYADVRGR